MSLAVWAGVTLEDLTGISSFLWSFLLGILGCTIGVFRMNLFDERSHSAGFLTVLIIGYLFTFMNGITPQSVLSVLPAVIALIVLSALGLGLGGYLPSLRLRQNRTDSGSPQQPNRPQRNLRLRPRPQHPRHPNIYSLSRGRGQNDRSDFRRPQNSRSSEITCQP